MTACRHIFGPVPSRRLGRSLGVDLTPFKICSLSCVFCQLGPTRSPTVRRREYVPLAGVLGELDDWMARDGEADYVTLSGSGEPTLHTGFGEVIRHVRDRSTHRTALLTNATLMGDPAVREAAAAAHVVKASVGAFDQASFLALNRPAPGLEFDAVLAGLARFREGFPGELWIEVFVVPGLNDGEEAIDRIAGLVAGLAPDRVQLNTAVRPPAEAWVAPATPEALAALAARFDPPAEVPAEYRAPMPPALEAGAEAILATLRRRPVTEEQLAQVAGLTRNELAKVLGRLLREGKVRLEREGGGSFYRAGSGRTRR